MSQYDSIIQALLGSLPRQNAGAPGGFMQQGQWAPMQQPRAMFSGGGDPFMQRLMSGGQGAGFNGQVFGGPAATMPAGGAPKQMFSPSPGLGTTQGGGFGFSGMTPVKAGKSLFGG